MNEKSIPQRVAEHKPSASKIVWRMQDNEGRGPFRPGFTKEWKGECNLDLPPIFVELGVLPHHLAALVPKGLFAGCAVQSILLLHKWFDRDERRRLTRFGYQVVEFEPNVILAETPTQVFFAHEFPLSTLNGEWLRLGDVADEALRELRRKMDEREMPSDVGSPHE